MDILSFFQRHTLHPFNHRSVSVDYNISVTTKNMHFLWKVILLCTSLSVSSCFILKLLQCKHMHLYWIFEVGKGKKKAACVIKGGGVLHVTVQPHQANIVELLGFTCHQTERRFQQLGDRLNIHHCVHKDNVYRCAFLCVCAFIN